ncbi:wax ester/triacylglycerol synthase family O-acyltransferase [Rubrivirga litoralis]|uniref:diacylglycerol O-acyltransferase n=1 Tax=Rubrivirga litoralis TaxID=3075598 RepID=A0ABU3BSB6_9BACT|nr:wax ester/triacylglycerol synthase family O-acyltransferase [Rubrivirga sp. F394]MDT0632178.1 wax ester/triacylglycerol synthase family O-acyltransferase [Rubrivirga sp. F394]
MRPRPVSTADAAWLRMESPTNPMTVTGVLGLGAEMSVDTLRRWVEERLLGFDRFRMRIDAPGSSSPTWVPDEAFDLDRHVIEVGLPAPGGQAGLEALVSRLMSTPLAFDCPPWTFHLVHGVQTAGGAVGSAIIGRLHHVIGDGIALMHVLLHAADEHHAGEAAPPRRPRASAVARVAGTLKEAGHEVLDLVTSPSHLADRVQTAGAGAQAVAGLLAMRPDSETVFKGSTTPTKRAAWTGPISLDRVKAVGDALGAKVNDVLMSAAAGGLRRYFAGRGEPVDGVEVRAAVPFNVRALDRAHELGNSFGLVFVLLPVGTASARERLRLTKERMDAIKRSAEPMVVYGILQTIGRAPGWAHRQVVKMFSEKASAVMTNVPGPTETLHLLGVPVETIMFWVPQAGDIGLGISIFSMNGTVRVGVGADAAYAPDPSALAEAFEAEFAALADEFAGGAEGAEGADD